MAPRLAALVAAAACLAPRGVAGGCSSRFSVPDRPPLATTYNGVTLPDTCFYTRPAMNQDGRHHVFLIGDWGGLTYHPWNRSFYGPVAADHRSYKNFPKKFRPFVYGVDDFAQRKVARRMAERALVNEPDYIINVGDNFYWGGVEQQCGAPLYATNDRTGQWEEAFESMYTGPGIDGKQWLSVLGNHDYGGYRFQAGWDSVIGYTWLGSAPSTGRWVQPSQYYRTKVHYTDFTIDYFFVDTNVFDTWEPGKMEQHNICSAKHNHAGVSCGVEGPKSPEDCRQWFLRLWAAEMAWLDAGLSSSKADWQIVVGHHPPEGWWGGPDWRMLAGKYGIDLVITGHRHRQEVHYMNSANPIKPTAYVVTGGGGGITSDGGPHNLPQPNGQDDEYGFMDLTLSKNELRIQAVSHEGVVRSTTCIHRSHPGGRSETFNFKGPTLCDIRTLAAALRQQEAPPPVATSPVVAQPVQQPQPQESRLVLGLKRLFHFI